MKKRKTFLEPLEEQSSEELKSNLLQHLSNENN